MKTPLFFAILSIATAAQAQDSVLGMCTDWGYSPAECSCAADLLRSEIGEQAYTDYDALALVYRRNQQSGMAMVPAWDGAVAETGADLSTTNTIGEYYSDVITTCE